MLRVTGLCAGNSPGGGEFPAQMASNAEMFPFDDVIMYNVKAAVPRISIPILKKKQGCRASFFTMESNKLTRQHFHIKTVPCTDAGI